MISSSEESTGERLARGGEFRVRVSLERYFSDERARCYVVAPPERSVRWLARRLRRTFALPRRLALVSRGHLLPPAEPLALLRPDDPVEVIPATAAVDDPRSTRRPRPPPARLPPPPPPPAAAADDADEAGEADADEAGEAGDADATRSEHSEWSSLAEMKRRALELLERLPEAPRRRRRRPRARRPRPRAAPADDVVRNERAGAGARTPRLVLALDPPPPPPPPPPRSSDAYN